MKNFKYIVLSILAPLAISCDSFLDKLPDERSEIKSENDVMELLMTAYPDANYAWMAELSSDNLLDNQCPHLPSNPNSKQVTTYYNYQAMDRFDEEIFRFEPAKSATFSSYDSPGSLWAGYYSSIAAANYCLIALDNLKAENDGTETARGKALRAEAQILRAWNHFCLVNLFCQPWKNAEASKNDVGVTYMTQPETESLVHYDRGTVAETYARIEEDLEAALPNISDAYIGSPKYHFNTQAAHAFAARFYLYKREWQKVIDHANEVLGTDYASTDKMMLDYKDFDDCSSISDYGKVWQNPKQNNNLMLSVTNSILSRRSFGYRYSVAGEKAAEVMMIRSKPVLWGGYIIPIQSLVGATALSVQSKDYGFTTSKIEEEFEYSDKLSGIGYPHIVQRTFTAANLLLERAEAKLMLGDVEGGVEDLCFYWNNAYNHFSEKNQQTYAAYWINITKDIIQRNYVNTEYKTNINCFDDWSFTQLLSADYVVSADIIPFMNCLNEFRRYETMLEGLRFFDLKRWGMPYEHKVGAESEIFLMGTLDTRRALEVPWETMSAGLESSRQVGTRTIVPTLDVKSLMISKD